MTIKQKLNALRILMKEKKIDAYLVTTISMDRNT